MSVLYFVKEEFWEEVMGKYEHEIVLNYLKRMLLNKYEAEDCNIENGLFSNELSKEIESIEKVIEIIENSD